MPLRLRLVVSLCLGLVAVGVLVGRTSAQTVWSGLTHSFSKPDGANGALPENQDKITDKVIFARGFAEGLYNAVTELNYNLDHVTSPESTLWATTLTAGNEELEQEDIVATNFANLEFGSWYSAFGGSGSLSSNIQSLNAVVYLEADNIYLDINFDFWGVGRAGGGGGFSYLRAEPPAPPVTNGDYNRNFVVDAADYTVWRDTFGDEVELGSGADGFADGIIDDLDYDFWKERFGNVILAGSGSGASAAVPEPASCLLLLSGWSIIATIRKRTPRGPGQTS